MGSFYYFLCFFTVESKEINVLFDFLNSSNLEVFANRDHSCVTPKTPALSIVDLKINFFLSSDSLVRL